MNTTYIPARKAVVLLVTLLCLHVTGGAKAEDYIFHDLYTLGTPSGYSGLSPSGIGPGGQVVGTVGGAGNPPTLWDQMNPSGIVLSPSEYALGTDGTQQVGDYITNGSGRAALWTGSADSLVDLNPAPVIGGVSVPWATSRAISGFDGQQVGFGSPSGSDSRALVWSGSSGTFVDLHPAGFSSSETRGVGGGKQTGFGYPANGGNARALLWSGTAASVVDLTPPNYLTAFAWATDGTQQVGRGYDANSIAHLLLWSGTAASWVDLGFGNYMYAVRAGKQVGFLGNSLTIWSGTSDSAVDLSSLLPANWGAAQVLNPQFEITQGPVALDEHGTVFAIVQDASQNYHAVEFVPTTAIRGALKIVSIQHLGNGHIFLQCTGVPNLTFSIQATTSLQFNFATIDTATADAAGNFSYEDTAPGMQHFYRLSYP